MNLTRFDEVLDKKVRNLVASRSYRVYCFLLSLSHGVHKHVPTSQ